MFQYGRCRSMGKSSSSSPLLLWLVRANDGDIADDGGGDDSGANGIRTCFKARTNSYAAAAWGGRCSLWFGWCVAVERPRDASFEGRRGGGGWDRWLLGGAGETTSRRRGEAALQGFVGMEDPSARGDVDDNDDNVAVEEEEDHRRDDARTRLRLIPTLRRCW